MQIDQSIKMVQVMALRMDPPVVLDVSRPLREVVHRMRDENAGCAVITHKGQLVGIFTERDLVARVIGTAGALDRPVADWMTPDPGHVNEDDTIRKAVRLMQRGGYRNIPVVDSKGNVVGCVRHKDIVNYLAEHFSSQVLNLPPDPEQIALEREGG